VVEVCLVAPAPPTCLHCTAPVPTAGALDAGRGGRESGHAMGGAAPPPAHAGGTGGRAQRQASGFLGPRIWRTLLLGGCNIRGGVFGVHGYTPPHPPSHLPHRAFPAIPDPVVAHRHGGSVLGAWSPAGGTVPCRPLPQPRPRAPIVPPPAPAARARDAGKEGGVMRWWRSFRCAPPVRLDVRCAPFFFTSLVLLTFGQRP
jgi:hypothetical protein